MTVVNFVAVSVTVLTLVTLIAGGIRWLSAVAVRLHKINDVVDRVESRSLQLERNGGTSLADAVHRIERRLDILEKAVIKSD